MRVCVVSCFCDILLCVLRERLFTRGAALLLGGSDLRKKTGQLAPTPRCCDSLWSVVGTH